MAGCFAGLCSNNLMGNGVCGITDGRVWDYCKKSQRSCGTWEFLSCHIKCNSLGLLAWLQTNVMSVNKASLQLCQTVLSESTQYSFIGERTLQYGFLRAHIKHKFFFLRVYITMFFFFLSESIHCNTVLSENIMFSHTANNSATPCLLDCLKGMV